MKSKWINWRSVIIDDERLSFGAKAIALYLNTYMNDSHDTAWPSIARMCAEMNITDKPLKGKLDELVKHGYLSKTKRHHNSIVYKALIPFDIVQSNRSISDMSEIGVLDSQIGESPVVKSENLRTNKQGNKQKNKQEVDLPKKLNKKAFDEYLLHRRQIRVRKLQPASQQKLIKTLCKYSHEQQQAAVDMTIMNGWTGLFPEKINEKGKRTTTGRSQYQDTLTRLKEDSVRLAGEVPDKPFR